MIASITDPACARPAALPTRLARSSALRRQFNPKAGRALEILGHAIEYLADEYAYGHSFVSANDGMLDAIRILMSLNRAIYFSCPEVSTLRERLQRRFRRKGDRRGFLVGSLLADGENCE